MSYTWDSWRPTDESKCTITDEEAKELKKLNKIDYRGFVGATLVGLAGVAIGGLIAIISKEAGQGIASLLTNSKEVVHQVSDISTFCGGFIGFVSSVSYLGLKYADEFKDKK